ncbi:hypothetical protein MMC13_000932 [Lambiella insularis]|nr:hypothetical protein [Lambiella insularis]
MSASGHGGNEATGGNKQQGFSKFMRRASKVLRSSSNRGSTLAGSESAAAAPNVNPPTQGTFAKPTTSSKGQQPKRLPVQPSELAVPTLPTTASAYNKLQEEKARALFAKYGMTLEPGEWTPVFKGDGGRVEKQVRMRVHRQCHRCQTTFGSEKICNSCSHTRCKKCPRFPTKIAKDSATKSATSMALPAAAVLAPTPGSKMRAKSLALPEQPTGNEVVRKTPVHRVRRTCHKCDTLFMGKATECANCRHLRCPKCPREPPKLSKFPNGYPGDVEETFPLAERKLRPIRTRIRWQCHGCNKMFTEHAKTCATCEHERCEQCMRHPPKRIKPGPSPEVLQSLEEKMARVGLEPAKGTVGP